MCFSRKMSFGLAFQALSGSVHAFGQWSRLSIMCDLFTSVSKFSGLMEFFIRWNEHPLLRFWGLSLFTSHCYLTVPPFVSGNVLVSARLTLLIRLVNSERMCVGTKDMSIVFIWALPLLRGEDWLQKGMLRLRWGYRLEILFRRSILECMVTSMLVNLTMLRTIILMSAILT